MRNYVKGMSNAMNQTQSQLDQRSRNAANREMIDAGTKFAGDLATYNVDSSRLGNLKESLARSYGQYYGMSEDPNADSTQKALALEKMQGLDLLDASTNIGNVGEFGDLYKTIMGDTSKYADLIGKQKVAQIRAETLKEIARVKTDNARRMKREELIYGENPSLGLESEGGQYSMPELLMMDDFLFQGE